MVSGPRGFRSIGKSVRSNNPDQDMNIPRWWIYGAAATALVAATVDSIRALAEVPRICELAFERARTGAHPEAAGHVVTRIGSGRPAPVEVNRGNRRVGHL